MIIYTHRVNYYETDKMGVTHHSNYIRWMEEARVDFLDKAGMPYAEMESLGIISPVVSIEAKYKRPTTFDDVIDIETTLESYNGIRLTFTYVMKNSKTGEVVLEARSSHCFLYGGRAVALYRTLPEVDKKFKAAIARLNA